MHSSIGRFIKEHVLGSFFLHRILFISKKPGLCSAAQPAAPPGSKLILGRAATGRLGAGKSLLPSLQLALAVGGGNEYSASYLTFRLPPWDSRCHRFLAAASR